MLLLICLFVSSFFFLSNFSNIKNFCHTFLKNWDLQSWDLVHTWMYWCIVYTYQNQAAAYLSLCFFIFLSLQFSNIKNFCHTFLKNWDLQSWDLVHTWMYWCIVYTYQNQAAAYLSLYFLIFLSVQFSNIKMFFALFSGTVRHTKLKLGTHMDNGWMYHVYQNQAAAFLSHYFFIFLSLQFTHMDNGWMYCVYWNQPVSVYLSLHFSFSPVFKH